jgi:anti-sigma factor RsiW
MSDCDRDRLDRLVAGELGGREIAEIRRHLAGCPPCTRELVLMRNDLRLFRMRAAALDVRPPEYESLRNRSRLDTLRRDRWMPSVVGLISTAALAALLLGAHQSVTREAPPSTGAVSSISRDAGSSQEVAAICQSSLDSCEVAAPMSWVPASVSESVVVSSEPDVCSANAPIACEPL